MDSETRQLKVEVDALKKTVDELSRLLKLHKHEGDDGSARIQKEIDLVAGQTVGAGGVGGVTALSDPVNDRTNTFLITGRDQSAADGVSNSQIVLEHQYATDAANGTRQTFFYGIRAPLFSGSSGDIKSGGTTLAQSDYQWRTDDLVGCYVVAKSGASFNCFKVTANTARSLTVDGTWTFGAGGVSYTVFTPVYLGSADYPWRRAYVGDLSAGGLRFGFGATAGGQNGLLYMNASGQLIWRNKAGGETTVAS